jgi:hypothetical protein
MKADEQSRLETNDLAAGAAAFLDRAKSGRLVSPKLLGVVLAVAVLGGVWWYVSTSNTRSASASWASFADIARTGGAASLEEYIKAGGNDTPGRLARLELARIKLGPDGIVKLSLRDNDQRTKAIASIEAARTELTELAGEFRGDKAMQAACLLDAAEAELALVGIAKSAGGSDFRGSVSTAADLTRQAADAVGPTTPFGETLIERAKELEANKAQIEEVGLKLNQLLTPPPSLVPSGGLGTPKAPEGKLPEITPPPPPADGPNAPAGPVTPPTVK